MDGLLIALFVIIAYIVLVYALKSKGILEKYNMSTWGPFIMWRTGRGRALVDRLARPRRFWQGYAVLGKVLVVATMISMVALLIWEATLVPSIPASSAPSPQMMLGIPGINPVIPVWYGILGLVIAVFVHEFAHGILTRVGDMKVKAMGIVWMVIPMGAFVEPDEEELVKTTKKKRTSVYAVGPGTNIILALICAFLVSMVMVSSVAPAHDGPVVVAVADNSPASMAGIPFGAQIVSVNNNTVPSDGYATIAAPDPNSSVTVTYYLNNELKRATLTSGVIITATSDGLPAAKANLTSGMMITSLNGITVRNESDLKNALATMSPGQPVPITALVYDSATGTYQPADNVNFITPISKKDYYASLGQTADDIAYIGVNSAYLGAGTNTPQALLDRLAHPFAGAEFPGGYISGALSYIALPFLGLEPLQSPMSDLFVPGGAFAWMPADLFWVVANSLYWIFWINLMLGMTNALPAVPLDGGYLFKDWLDALVSKLRKGADQKQRDAMVNSITWAFALLVLFLIVWQLVGPRIL